MKTYKVIMFTLSGSAEICEARRLTDEEKTHYAEWFRDYGFVSLPGTHVALENVKWRDLPDRKPDGEFCGCSNRAYILTDAEAESYIALNEQRGQQAERDANAAEIKRLENVISQCEKQGLYTEEEAKRMTETWTWVENENGDGYVPHYWTRQEYEDAVRVLNDLKAGRG